MLNQTTPRKVTAAYVIEQSQEIMKGYFLKISEKYLAELLETTNLVSLSPKPGAATIYRNALHNVFFAVVKKDTSDEKDCNFIRAIEPSELSYLNFEGFWSLYDHHSTRFLNTVNVIPGLNEGATARVNNAVKTIAFLKEANHNPATKITVEFVPYSGDEVMALFSALTPLGWPNWTVAALPF